MHQPFLWISITFTLFKITRRVTKVKAVGLIQYSQRSVLTLSLSLSLSNSSCGNTNQLGCILALTKFCTLDTQFKSVLIRHQAWGYHKQGMKKNGKEQKKWAVLGGNKNKIQFSSSYLFALSVEQISSIKILQWWIDLRSTSRLRM